MPRHSQEYILKQDNPNIHQEQSIHTESHQRPGDVLHPDFKDGKPTYFDVSVVNPLQPGNINDSSHNAGAAAANREAEKDQKFFDSVAGMGGVFIPLVVETYGRWTPFACSTLKVIAPSIMVCLKALPFTTSLSSSPPIFRPTMILHHLATLLVDLLWDLP